MVFSSDVVAVQNGSLIRHNEKRINSQSKPNTKKLTPATKPVAQKINTPIPLFGRLSTFDLP